MTSCGCSSTYVMYFLLMLRQALEREVYDIVCMDIHMPVMDGLEASRHVSERYPEGEGPRIIALSADTMQSLHERCKAVGIREIICKPFRVEDLQRMVRAHGQRRVRYPMPKAPPPAAALPPAPLLPSSA